MNATIAHDRAVHDNPVFERSTIKSNSENGYCRSYISELFDYYIPEFRRYVFDVDAALKGKPVEKRSYSDIVDAFYEKPLSEMKYLNPLLRTPAGYSKLMVSYAAMYK